MEQPSIKENVVELTNDLKDYANSRSELLGLQIRKTAAELIGNIGSSLILLIFAAMFFVFGSFALAYYIAEIYNSMFIGFISIAGLYFLLLLIALLLKNSVRTSITNTIIKTLFKGEDHESHQE
jgi:hypothetical protein